MLKHKLILAFVLFLLVPFVYGAVYTQNEEMFISKSVRIGGYPSSSILCNITLLDPDEIGLYSFAPMVNNATTQKHEFTASGINKTGEYCYDVTCAGGGFNETASYCDDVTPNGLIPSTASGIFYLGIFAVLVLFLVLSLWAITEFENIIVRFSLFQFVYLLVIAITFISYMMASDFITSAPFIISMFEILFWVVTIAFFPYVLGMMVWLGYSMITIKEIKDMMERGIPLEEAQARRKNKKW